MCNEGKGKEGARQDHVSSGSDLGEAVVEVHSCRGGREEKMLGTPLTLKMLKTMTLYRFIF